MYGNILFKLKEKKLYFIRISRLKFAGSVLIVKNCDLGLEHFQDLSVTVFSTRTDPKPAK